MISTNNLIKTLLTLSCLSLQPRPFDEDLDKRLVKLQGRQIELFLRRNTEGVFVRFDVVEMAGDGNTVSGRSVVAASPIPTRGVAMQVTSRTKLIIPGPGVIKFCDALRQACAVLPTLGGGRGDEAGAGAGGAEPAWSTRVAVQVRPACCWDGIGSPL